MKLSLVLRYIQKTKECRNSFLGILIFHEIMFHVSMFYSLCHFLLTATELYVAYQLDGASLFFTLPRSRCPPCPTASSRRPQSSRRWTPRLTPSWPARPAGLGSCSSRRPTSTPPGTPASPGRCAPAAVLRGRLRLGAGAARQVVDNLLLEGEAHVHIRHPCALSRGVRLL